MLLRSESEEKFGYEIEKLSFSSNKKMLVKCDYCEAQYETCNKVRNKSNAIINKDACNKCKYIKRDECCIAKYGVTNPGATQEVKDKIKETIKEKYGTESYTQTAEFLEKSNATKIRKFGTINTAIVPELVEKRKQTMLERYGVESPLQCKEIKEKVQQTNLERYGNKEYLASDEARSRIVKTNLERFGVENPFANDDIKEKIRQTHQINLGVDYPTQSSIVREKCKQTVMNRYNVDNVFQDNKVKEQIRATNLDKYGYENPSHSPEILNKTRETNIKNGNLQTFNGKTRRELADTLDKAYTTFNLHVREFGFEIACQMETKINGLEFIVQRLLDKHNISYKQHARINGRYTDFLIEDSKLIIETDGLYWHSDAILKDDNYHAIKQQNYTDAGYKSLFFREDEVYNKLDIVESVILNAMQKSERIFARKCKVGIIPTQESALFFQTNHLMGRGAGKTYGLYYNNELVSAMRIKRTKNLDYEISRFCNKMGVGVTGAFSKILSCVENDLRMYTLTTFIDRRYGTGQYLNQFGFEQKSTHISFKWVDGQVSYNRLRFSGNSGYEEGLSKIWDCGQTKFVKEYQHPLY